MLPASDIVEPPLLECRTKPIPTQKTPRGVRLDRVARNAILDAGTTQ
jgi:hypothetical protein